jgi:hypothetical protein
VQIDAYRVAALDAAARRQPYQQAAFIQTTYNSVLGKKEICMASFEQITSDLPICVMALPDPLHSADAEREFVALKQRIAEIAQQISTLLELKGAYEKQAVSMGTYADCSYCSSRQFLRYDELRQVQSSHRDEGRFLVNAKYICSDCLAKDHAESCSPPHTGKPRNKRTSSRRSTTSTATGTSQTNQGRWWRSR